MTQEQAKTKIAEVLANTSAGVAEKTAHIMRIRGQDLRANPGSSLDDLE